MEDASMSLNDGYRPVRPATVRDPLMARQTAAWRAPGATRFDSRPANDFLARADAIAPRTLYTAPAGSEPLPRWIVVAIGGLIAALLGALLGGALHL